MRSLGSLSPAGKTEGAVRPLSLEVEGPVGLVRELFAHPKAQLYNLLFGTLHLYSYYNTKYCIFLCRLLCTGVADVKDDQGSV